MKALVEVIEGKKLRKRGKEGKFQKSEKEKRENIEVLYERLKKLKLKELPICISVLNPFDLELRRVSKTSIII